MSLFSKLAAFFMRSSKPVPPERKVGFVDKQPRQPHSGHRLDMPKHFDATSNADILSGMTFCATMQLRTPLRVLTRHAEVHLGDYEPPVIAREQWEGIWLPRTKTWVELGINARGPALSTMASDIGQIPQDGGEYLKFLLAVRTIVEGEGDILTRRDRLKEEVSVGCWSPFVRKLGGKSRILDRIFPPFLGTISGLTEEARDVLRKRGLKTPAKLGKVDDKSLLIVAGIGPAKLKVIRLACAAADDPGAEFLEEIIR